MLTVKDTVADSGKVYYIQIEKSDPISTLNYLFQIFQTKTAMLCNYLTTGSSCEFVTDGSFEYYSNMSCTQNKLFRTCDWKKGTYGTADYFNSACPYIVPNTTNVVGVDVPVNAFGDQLSMQPMVPGWGPAVGAGYAGFFAHMSNVYLPLNFVTIPHLHEYVRQHLKTPLKKGVTYNVSFWVSLADRSTIAANNIGMFLSQSQPYEFNYDLLSMTAGSVPLYGGVPVVPQISQRLMPSIGTSFIADKINWVQIMGTIIGNGEEWITIGNFDNTVSLPVYTTGVPVGFTDLPDPYYYVDNVSIEAVSFDVQPATASVCTNAQISLSTDPAINVTWAINFPVNATLSCYNCNPSIATVTGNSSFYGTYSFISPAKHNSLCNLTSNNSVINVGSLGLSATANPSTILPFQSSALNLSYVGNNGTLSYSWSPVASLNNSLIQNPTASPLYTTTYNVNVNNGQGCNGTTNVTVDVFQSICDQEIAIDYTSNPGDYASNVFGSIPIVSNKNIIISGNLTIDYDIRFDNCNLIMGSGASITLNANLEITNKTHISSCKDMWDGIYIPSDFFSIKVDGNSIIEDAFNAIVSDNGGIYTIDHAIFNRNVKSIVVKNNVLPINPGEIRSSLFTSRYLMTYLNPQLNPSINAILPTIDLLPSVPLKAPYESSIANIGILSEDNLYIKIGDNLEKGTLNYFDNLGCGIYVDNSNCYIYNNKFQNMVSSTSLNACNTCPPLISTAIYAIGNYPSTGNAITIGGYFVNDVPDFKRNYFQDVYKSIDIQGYDQIDVINNKFTNKANISNWSDYGTGKFAIFVSEPPSDNEIIIDENEIQNNYDGIVVYRSGAKSNTNSTVLIRNNNLKATGQNNTCALGIAFSDISFANPGNNQEISDNTIINTDLGIYASDVSGLIISRNTVGISYKTNPPKNTTGIELESCEDVYLYENCNIYCTSPSIYTIANPIVSGIYVYDSKGVHVTSNRIENTTRALTFEMDCSNSPLGKTVVESNHFHDSYYGLYMLNDGKIGVQGDPGSINNPLRVTENKWIDNFTFKTFVNSNTTSDVNFDSKFYVRDDGMGLTTETLPTSNSQIGSMAFYNLGTSTSNGFQILPGTVETQVDNVYNCNAARTAMRTMVAYPIDSFNINNAVGSIQEKLLDSVGLFGYEVETEWQNKKYVMDKLNIYPTLQNSTDTINDFYLQNNYGNLGLLSYSQKAIKQGYYAVAATYNNWVNATSQIEQNQKFVNELILKRELGQALNSSDTVNLLDIALQCKLAGGKAVLQARDLYCAITHQFRLFDDNCLSFLGAREKHSKIVGKETLLFDLFPNPASENIFVKYKLPFEGNSFIRILDITGHEFKSYSLSKAIGNLTITTEEIPQGVYLVYLTCNDQKSKVSKLIIVE